MSIAVKVSVEITGTDLEVIARGAGDLTPFHKKVNVLMLQRAQRRLASKTVRSEVRSGNLVRSLAIGGPKNINRLGRNFGEIGSALEYARKVNDGGRIFPKNAKALAVPVTQRTKRSRLWPRDVDPGRQRLQLIPREGKPPLLVDPDDDTLVWVLMRSVDWGPGYKYLRFDEQDKKDIAQMFFKHLGLSPN